MGRELLGHLLQGADCVAGGTPDGRVQTIELGLDVFAVIWQQLGDMHQLARHHPGRNTEAREEDQDDQHHGDGSPETPSLQQLRRRREQEVEDQREGHGRQQIAGKVKREDDQSYEQQRLAGQEAATLPGWGNRSCLHASHLKADSLSVQWPKWGEVGFSCRKTISSPLRNRV